MRFPVLPLCIILTSCDCSRPIVWEEPEESEWTAVQFGGEGEALWTDGVLHLDLGVEMTGSRYEGEFPEIPYEVRLETRKLNGSDFFCGLTFPARGKETFVSLIVGGWGGGTVGISSIDGLDASENETTSYHAFELNQWYAVKVRVEADRISAWIDGEKLVDVVTEGRELGLRSGPVELCTPFGLAAWQTEAEFRNLEWRSLVD